MLRRFVLKRTRQFTSSMPLLAAGIRVVNSEQLSTPADFGPQPSCFSAFSAICKQSRITEGSTQYLSTGLMIVQAAIDRRYRTVPLSFHLSSFLFNVCRTFSYVRATSPSPNASAEIEQTRGPLAKSSSATDTPHRVRPDRAPTQAKAARDGPVVHLLGPMIVRATPLQRRRQQVDDGCLCRATRAGIQS
jgi:hypothetical protein